MKDVSLIVNGLKTLIDREGLDYLNDYPDKACASLLNSDCADKFTALALLTHPLGWIFLHLWRSLTLIRKSLSTLSPWTSTAKMCVLC